MGPNTTGHILVLYGHGAVTSETFELKREAEAKINLYSWTREGIPVWDTQIQLAADDAIDKGEIRQSYATVNSSRIGGSLFKDYVIGSPDGLRLPAIPAGFSSTVINELGATAYHNAPDLANSNRILLMIIADAELQTFSKIISDVNFKNRSFDVLWCACKSDFD